MNIKNKIKKLIIKTIFISKLVGGANTPVEIEKAKRDDPARLARKKEFTGFFDLADINGFFVDDVSAIAEIALEEYIKSILKKEIPDSFINGEERGYPNFPEFLKNGYYKTMLKRYLFAAYNFSKNKRVLETCCGLGWGAYLVSGYAKDVVAFDIDEKALHFCREEWVSQNIKWVKGNALDFSFLNGEKFDVVLAMETIEHFKKEDGEKYIYNILSALSNNGIVIGTSYFPQTRVEAVKLAKTNKHHHYIWTLNEMEDLLKKYFKGYVIINNWMFIGKKII